VIVNRMQDAHPGTAALAASVESAFGIAPNINLYASPEGLVGLTAHHDPQDVIIVQIDGSKEWRVCAPMGPGALLPTRVSDDTTHRLYYRYSEEQLTKTTCEVLTMGKGDVLYMPRGTIHSPQTLQEGSTHQPIP
jgi:bifunctional lysine-specific demethylase and histidyl-hydroxylase NO66